MRCFLVERCNERGEGNDFRFDVRRADTGKIIATDQYYLGHADMPVGAMWWQSISYHAREPGPGDHLFFAGDHLKVMTPGGIWNIDSRASNCTMPDDMNHRCWVRHGDPPNVTVDKNGVTCAAGAGSIQCGDYHGFLTAGDLTGC